MDKINENELPKFGLNLAYMMTHFAGLWSYENNNKFYKFYQVYLPFNYLLLMALHLIAERILISSLELTVLNFIIIFTYFRMAIKYFVLIRYQSRIKKILNNFSEMYFEYALNSMEEKKKHFHSVNKNYLKSNYIYTVIAIITNLLWSLDFLTKPVVEMERKISRIEIEDFTWSLPTAFTMPFPIRSKLVFWIICIHNLQIVFWTLFIILGSDYIYLELFDYLAGHIHILGHELQKSGQLTNEKMQQSLKNSIQYQNYIYRICREIEIVCGLDIFLHCASFIIIVSFSGYLVTTIEIFSETFNKVGFYICFNIFQLYLIIRSGQRVYEEILNIGYNAYSTTWYDVNRSNRLYILMIILRGNRALPLKATTFMEITKETFSRLVNSSFSYITVLQNMDMS